MPTGRRPCVRDRPRPPVHAPLVTPRPTLLSLRDGLLLRVIRKMGDNSMRILALASALAFLATGALAQDVVRMGTEGAYPPYSYLNDAGELEGYEIDLGNEICARAGLTCEWVTNEWDSIIPNLVSGNYDTIMAGMTITPERDEVIDFTQSTLR